MTTMEETLHKTMEHLNEKLRAQQIDLKEAKTKFNIHIVSWLKAEEDWIETEKGLRDGLDASAKIFDEAGARIEQLQDAITAALGEIKRNDGSPRLGLRGIERILSNALEGVKS